MTEEPIPAAVCTYHWVIGAISGNHAPSRCKHCWIEQEQRTSEKVEDLVKIKVEPGHYKGRRSW